MKRLVLAAALSALSALSPAAGQTASNNRNKEATDILKLQWEERFWSCRNPDTANASIECAKRDSIGRQLKARGLCLVGAYSTEGDLMHVWRHCPTKR